MVAMATVLLCLQSLRLELGSLRSERDGLQSSLTSHIEAQELLQSELSTVQSELVTSQAQTSSSQRSAEQAQTETATLREELGKEKESHSETRQKLAAALKVAMGTPTCGFC